MLSINSRAPPSRYRTCGYAVVDVAPKYLDSKGLIAAWREALLAQKVLTGKTKGYRHHPQLARFRALPDPLAAIATFLAGMTDEARRRGYPFDLTRSRLRRTIRGRGRYESYRNVKAWLEQKQKKGRPGI